MIQHFWQSIFQSVISFETVVENNDSAIACMPDHVSTALLRGKVNIKVPTEHVPHDNLHLGILRLDFFDLRLFDPAIRRAEQLGPGELLAFLKVLDIGVIRSFPAFQVMVSMVAYTMPLILYQFKNFGMFEYVISDAKKSSFSLVLC